ncbi:MAG: DUF2118 domain-containing protein [Clostridia bacterium]|nr:DUF2118 domain-containing protein [Clostridia bacterium]
MADLYRKNALERISSPDQLDKALKITSPLSWLALIGVTLIVAAAVIWSVFGSIPVTLTAQGIVSPPSATNAVYSHETGTVADVRVENGDRISKGDVLLTYTSGSGSVQELVSDQDGVVSLIRAEAGTAFVHGEDVIRLAPETDSRQVVVCYVPLAYVVSLKEDMKVQVSLASVDSQSLGFMEARISNIDSFASSADGMAHVIGYGNGLDSMFLSGGAVAAVTCILTEDSSTVSGYAWSNKNGGEVTVPTGSMVTAKIILDEVPPITKLFASLQDVWGD